MLAFHVTVAAFVGMAVGSFLNVVIWRLPQQKSLMRPPSHCPGCGTGIRWYDNLPVLSWLLLRGRCRACSTGISIRYPMVEALTGALFALAVLRWSDDLVTAAIVSLGLAALVAISYIDWDHKIIPDVITKPGIALAILIAPASRLHPGDWIEGVSPALSAWMHAGAGAVAGALVILAVRWLGYLAFRKEAMGLGDVKLLALIGSLTGPLFVLHALVLACFVGVFLGGARLLLTRGRPLRFDLEVKGKGVTERFELAKIDGEALIVQASGAAGTDLPVKLRMRLPAAGILEDQDAKITVGGRVTECRPSDDGHTWRIQVEKASDTDLDRLAMLAASYRYVPFGPFLAIGGAVALLYGEWLHWFMTEGWPRWLLGAP